MSDPVTPDALRALNAYQQQIAAWHAQRWPDYDPANEVKVALKGCEEMGEVAAAILKRQGDAALMAECGDVLNVIAQLLTGRGIMLSTCVEYAMTVTERHPVPAPDRRTR